MEEKTHDRSTESSKLNISRALEVHHQEPQLRSLEVTHPSLSAQIKLASDFILEQVERLCALLTEKKRPEIRWKLQSYRLASR